MTNNLGQNSGQYAVLCILDGWGIAPDSADNAISQANLPNYRRFLQHYPHTSLQASGPYVGLPDGQIGNSEVGHMTIGAGRLLQQDLPRINADLTSMLQGAKFQQFLQDSAKIHILGMISPGGVHGHMDHIIACYHQCIAKGKEVILHGFLDGRDTETGQAANFLQIVIDQCPDIKIGSIAGRYYAMDRDHNWDRIEIAFRAISEARLIDIDDSAAKSDISKITEISDLLRAIANEKEEFFAPWVAPFYSGISREDGVIMTNFRADRARQIMQAIAAPKFDHFKRNPEFLPKNALGFCSYAKEMDCYLDQLFAPNIIDDGLTQLIAAKGLSQLRTAETEKYAHVTFFMSGGTEDLLPKEKRVLVASPKVKSYDLLPEMAAEKLCQAICDAIGKDDSQVIITNFANPDMVGHSGSLEAAIKAAEFIDRCLALIEEKILQHENAFMLVTADHGNLEQMRTASGGPHTAHTLNPVPLILVGRELLRKDNEGITDHIPIADIQLKSGGTLSDIAPTMLDLLSIDKSNNMTGHSLLQW